MITKKYITQLSYDIVGCAIKVHKILGPGLLEDIYEQCLAHALEKNGMIVTKQMKIPVYYEYLKLETDLQLDLLVNNLIVVELKATEDVYPVHEAKLMTYMKLLKAPQGLLINFFTKNLTASVKPFVNEYFNELPD
jgi:GxxExxY protein